MLAENVFLVRMIAWAYVLIGAVCSAAILRRAQLNKDRRRGFPYPTMGMLLAVLILWLPFMVIGLVVEGSKYYAEKMKKP